MPLLDKLSKSAKNVKAPDAMLWKGPSASGPMGGVTFSMLNAFLQCRERFRIRYVLGLRPPETFSHHLEYGHMWHTCEEAHAKGVEWLDALEAYANSLLKKYPTARDQIDKWYRACQVQFPIYVHYWSKHKDVETRVPLSQEQVFDVPYCLPSGRTVRLRGKFDSVDLIGKGKNAGVYLQENKTKGDVDPDALRKQLRFDLQTMMYLTALYNDSFTGYESEGHLASDFPKRIKGVRYNVVRRPLSGGKGMIKQKKATKNHPAETADEYWKRLQQYFIDEPQHWFMRWKAEVTSQEVKDFQVRCLNPILEQLCDWYEWIARATLIGRKGFESDHDGTNPNTIHWQHPYGATNMLNEGYGSDVDSFIETGSEAGLVRRTKLFEELQ